MPFMITMPKLSPTMEEGVIAKWYKKEGEYVEAGAILLEITTDKATVEHTALDEGWLRKIFVKEGSAAAINQPIALFTVEQNENIDTFQLPSPPPAPKEEKREMEGEEIKEERVVAREPLFIPEPPLQKPFTVEEGPMRASPLAKRMAEEENLDLSSVKGTGPGGRITKDDLAYALPKALVSFGQEEIPDLLPGSYEEIPLTPMRKAIAKRLQAAKSFIPHFYVKQTIDAQGLFQMREELKRLGYSKITYNDMLIRGTALALRKHPQVNSGFNSQSQCLVRFKTIDISVAVTLPEGLITPIIRFADYKNLGQISTEMRKLADRARQNKLKEEEYRGGSFSISNLGMYGIDEFTAVLNPPQAAILAIGALQPNHKLTLTLSCDHRVIDGSDAAQFLKTLREILETPSALLI